MRQCEEHADGIHAPDIGTDCDFLWLQSFTSGIPAMSQQAIHAVQIAGGPKVLVLGCPGGRVRIVQPGTWRTGDSTPQGAGAVLASSNDLGFGGGALAVRTVSGGLQAWFGTVQHPAARPSGYGSASGSLAAGEEVSAAVHCLTWSPGQGSVPVQQTVLLNPSTVLDRGAYGVVGMKLADLDPQNPGENLIVATMSGDLIVYDVAPAGTLTERGRTFVPGSIGFHNSIAVEDLNGDSLPEIYVAGSLGLWRFVHMNEAGVQ